MKKNKLNQIAQLVALLTDIKDQEIMDHFLYDLCTPKELDALADRWQVVMLLKKGLSYRDIYAATGISLTTISRVARHLHLGAGGYEKAYEIVEPSS